MTDIISREQAEDTIAALQHTLTRYTEQTQVEAAEQEARKQRFVQVGHDRATRHGIGQAFDRLMEELDMPARAPSYEWGGRVLVAETIDRAATSEVRVLGGATIYPTATSQVLNVYTVSDYRPLPEGATCLCGNGQRSISRQMTGIMSDQRAEEATYQILMEGCTHPSCVNGDGVYNRVARDSSATSLTSGGEVFTYEPPLT